jgi:hypothetical protein
MTTWKAATAERRWSVNDTGSGDPRRRRRDPPVGEGPGKVLTGACARVAHDRTVALPNKAAMLRRDTHPPVAAAGTWPLFVAPPGR